MDAFAQVAAVFGVVLLVVGVVVAIALLCRESALKPAFAQTVLLPHVLQMPTKVRPVQSGAGIYRGSSYQETPEDEQFTAIFEDAFADRLEFGFYTTVAGASHRNDDGTLRRRIIRECGMGERLDLIHETQNVYDKNAVAVKRANGEQLGYLHADTALQVVQGLKKGRGWAAFFRKRTMHPETGKLTGGVILLLCCIQDAVQVNVQT